MKFLISENEMTDTYQIKNGYVLISNKSYYSSKLKKIKKNKFTFGI